MTIQISGAVDNSRMFNILGGWARTNDDGEDRYASVVACEDEEVICRAEANLRRGEQERCGFILTLPRDITPEDLRNGKIKVYAAVKGQRKLLPFIDSMLDAFEARATGYKYANSSDYTVRNLIAGLTMNSSSAYRKYLARAALRVAEQGRDGLIDGITKKEFSEFLLPVGLKSNDGTAVTGRDGTLFLLGGTNSILDLYRRKRGEQFVEDVSDRWVETCVNRAVKLKSWGIRYLQVNIPDKSSVLPELFPVEIPSPTPLMEAVKDKLLVNAAVSGCYVEVLKPFIQDEKRRELFQKTDSHLSPYGCCRVLELLLGNLDCAADLGVGSYIRKSKCGDLGEKYNEVPLMEMLAFPNKGKIFEYEPGLELKKRFIPPDGHSGARIVWTNSSAPVNLRVVAFANSFFSHGEDAVGVSWWAARCFREFHFIWESNVDFSYVEHVRPDVVICQTVERFLRRPAEM